MTSGCVALISLISHSQKRSGLVWGLSTRKMRTPCSIQKQTTLLSSSQSALPVLGFEVKRDKYPHTFSAGFRHIARCHQGASETTRGAPAHRDDRGRTERRGRARPRCHTPGLWRQMPKILQRAELWMHGLVPAGRRANGPGAARVVGRGHGGIVLALAVHLADRVNGWQIEHVEAHVRNIGQTRLTVLEGAVLARHRGAGAWEHLVPGAEAGFGAIDHHG